MWFQGEICPEKCQLDQIENDRIVNIIDFIIYNVHGKLCKLARLFTAKQNVRVQGRMHPENSYHADGGIWWPPDLLLQFLKYQKQCNIAKPIHVEERMFFIKINLVLIILVYIRQHRQTYFIIVSSVLD